MGLVFFIDAKLPLIIMLVQRKHRTGAAKHRPTMGLFQGRFMGP
jgi:hypothetical protein